MKDDLASRIKVDVAVADFRVETERSPNREKALMEIAETGDSEILRHLLRGEYRQLVDSALKRLGTLENDEGIEVVRIYLQNTLK